MASLLPLLHHSAKRGLRTQLRTRRASTPSRRIPAEALLAGGERRGGFGRLLPSPVLEDGRLGGHPGKVWFETHDDGVVHTIGGAAWRGGYNTG